MPVSSSRTKTSVKVPPVSTATRNEPTTTPLLPSQCTSWLESRPEKARKQLTHARIFPFFFGDSPKRSMLVRDIVENPRMFRTTPVGNRGE
jgi:hypothetical protein